MVVALPNPDLVMNAVSPIEATGDAPALARNDLPVPTPPIGHTYRESWLADAVMRIRPWFAALKYEVPEVRVSIGFPSTGRNGVHIGQCWPTTRSVDGVNQIFVSPVLEDPVSVLDTLVHELVHAVDDCKNRHGAPFRKIALAIGLQGPMRSASAGKELKVRLTELASQLGPYPHAKLTIVRKPVTRKPRPRARCEECGYEVPMLKRFIHFGAPICPLHRIEMEQLGHWETTDETRQAA